MVRPSTCTLFLLSCLLLGPAPGVAVTWIQGGGGASCSVVCQARGGCDESAWPKSLEAFEEIVAAAGKTCEATQEGGAKYDPSTDGRYCGWNGPEPADESPRCEATVDGGTHRFCPCNTDKEL
mmetsp:Transcript_46705/g.101967  ORF Transcript_46705/g.101967 Transcript_46705/m.101967 type:complete len:123 (+) Transcript_46705:65-433(+)